jgi:hypothetical protein
MGDRFYGTANLIAYCRRQSWDYRLKGNLKVYDGANEYHVRDLEFLGLHFLKDVCITDVHQQTHLAVIHEENYPKSWVML